MDLSPHQFSPAMMPKQKPSHKPSSYSLTPHAARQAEAKGWSHDQVLEAANNHEIEYDNGRYAGQKRRIRGDIVAVVHPDTMTVRTVYKNVDETDLRPDQKDRDAQRYGARRGGTS